tara:strand:+ start:836 stop:1198 length:363 start_codon:yes stop_codon:yes gene_type:complete
MRLTQSIDLSLKKELRQDEYDPNYYKWINLGVVCQGIRNDEGIVLVEMKIGTLKSFVEDIERAHYPKHLIRVIEKYYGSGVDGTRHNEPHLIEEVSWRRPTNLMSLINNYKGKDKRTKWK